jgi:hypothetical protein
MTDIPEDVMKLAPEVPEIEPVATDVLLIVRDGYAYLRGPAGEAEDVVPDDFLVVLGVAMAFNDDGFRAMMKALVKRQTEAGIVDHGHEPIH